MFFKKDNCVESTLTHKHALKYNFLLYRTLKDQMLLQENQATFSLFQQPYHSLQINEKNVSFPELGLLPIRYSARCSGKYMASLSQTTEKERKLLS